MLSRAMLIDEPERGVIDGTHETVDDSTWLIGAYGNAQADRLEDGDGGIDRRCRRRPLPNKFDKSAGRIGSIAVSGESKHVVESGAVGLRDVRRKTLGTELDENCLLIRVWRNRYRRADIHHDVCIVHLSGCRMKRSGIRK